ncbi:MAG: flagellar biosynthetic protein FliR [Treponemataceae bacterium]|nr:MAG: flagellar biosynthetic protein FliR [Treponemataceae bacterium]
MFAFFLPIAQNAPLFFLVFARSFALLLTTPLISTRAVNTTAKAALALYMAFLLMPQIVTAGYEIAYAGYGAYNLEYALLLVGEAIIGVITGFYITIIFSAFSTAGQFFSFQTGLSAAEAYDALSQVENPILGQFLNLIAMLIFLQTDGFQQLFLGGLQRSFQSFNALALVTHSESFYSFLLSGLSSLFFNAFVISLPIAGTLFLVSVSMGILSKAAPQMNLLSEGLPITMSVSFLLLFALIPSLCDFFMRVVNAGFASFEQLLIDVKVNPL